ncbi:MAG: rRNA pseudouridine synthase [Oscillospiraceae bacterium]|nr:rRNA pseudouridine synthase [Oscillospiraceae bacterium]
MGRKQDGSDRLCRFNGHLISEDAAVRLQKYIAGCGYCSRRKAEELLLSGRVTVNGVKASLGDGMEEGDVVCVDGEPLSQPTERTYVMLHKPKGYVTTLSDEKGRPTVAELTADAGVRLFPVGRLDLNSEGLLILTDDGEIANRLAHPSHGVEKTYRVWVKGENAAGAAERLRGPMEYRGVSYRGAKVSLLRSDENSAVMDVTIGEGKNREVRNMCAAAGLRVKRLLRLQQGELKLGDLPPGQWRYLTDGEILYLHKIL